MNQASQEGVFDWFLQAQERSLSEIQQHKGPVLNQPHIERGTPTADSHAGSVTVEVGGSKASCSITLQLVEEGNPPVLTAVDCGPLVAHKALAAQVARILSRIHLQFEDPVTERGWILQYSVSMFLINHSGSANIPSMVLAYYECFKAATRPLDLYAEVSERVAVLNPDTPVVFAASLAYIETYDSSNSNNAHITLIRNPTVSQFKLATGHVDVIGQGDIVYFMDAQNVPHHILKQLLCLSQ